MGWMRADGAEQERKQVELGFPRSMYDVAS